MIGPSPTTAIQHAHKARLQRFAEAAARHADTRQALILEGSTKRREYETATRLSSNAPIVIRILRAVANEFGVDVETMVSARRNAKCYVPRYVAIGLMIELTPMSLPAIGRRLGGRNHSTIVNGRRRILTLLTSEAFRNRFDQIKAEIAA